MVIIQSSIWLNRLEQKTGEWMNRELNTELLIPVMNSQAQKHRKLIRAMPHNQPNRYFDTLDLNNLTLDKALHHSGEMQTHTLNVNPFSKKSIDKNMHTYIHDLPSKKFLERRITNKDLKNNKNSARNNSNADRLESISLARVSRENRRSEDHSFADRSHGKLKYASISKEKAGSGLDRYHRSSMSSPYTDGVEERRRAISRTHDTVTLKQAAGSSSARALESGKKLYKQNRLDEAISVLSGLSRSKKVAECEYLLGLCHMNKGQYENAIRCLQELLKMDPLFKRNIYLLVGIAWKKLNRIELSIKTVTTRGLAHFHDYFDALVYRGKLHLKKGAHHNALQDFQKASELQPEKGFPWVGMADSLKAMGKAQEAIEALDKALCTDAHQIARLRRANLQFELNNCGPALEDINKYLQLEPRDSEGLYHKGMIVKKQGQISEALMVWEEAVKEATNEGFVERALEEMLKTKIEQRDFYEASHIISRFSSPMVIWRLFIEATLLLMKKKYEEGIVLYNSSELSLFTKAYSAAEKSFKNEDERIRYTFLKPMIHTYRAYGYFSLNNLDKAMADYILYDSYCRDTHSQEINPSKEYNCRLIKAIQQFPSGSKEYLLEALELYPSKSEPFLYLSMCQIQTYLIEEEPDILEEAKSNLTKAVNFLPQLSNNHVSSIYYHRAVLLLYLNEFEASVTDIDKAIEKSEDNIPKYFYLRGLIFGCCLNYSQAIQDYTVCINLDATFAKAFIQRAKCLQMEGNITEAFNDLQKYISLKPNDALINQYAASLLFQNCAYTDCLVALSHSKIDDPNNLKTKAKCHLLLGDLDTAITHMQEFSSITSTNLDHSSVDLGIMKCLKQLSFNNYKDLEQVLSEFIDTKGCEGEMFKITDMLVLRGCTRCCLNKLKDAEADFMSSLSLKEILKRKEMLEMEIQMTENDDEADGVGWTVGQAYYCLSVCNLLQKKFKSAHEYFLKSLSDQMFKEEEWSKYRTLLKALSENSSTQDKLMAEFSKEEIDLDSCSTFMSKFFHPVKVDVGSKHIMLPLILNYPDIEAPSMTPQFDHELLVDFRAQVVEPKPEAPWITRKAEGVVFTSDVQVFDNLELSVTSVNPKEQRMQSEISMISQQSLPVIPRDNLKEHFKLDDDIEQKLKKMLEKKKPT